jgi:glutamate-5-semialdehyde dehydrogenase
LSAAISRRTIPRAYSARRRFLLAPPAVFPQAAGQDMGLRESIEREAAAAQAAVVALTDAAVAETLALAAELVGSRTAEIAEANAQDLAAAEGRLDEGSVDRLRLDETRIATLAAQLVALSSLPPLEREEDSWKLENGLHVSVRRIPVGVVGANFEARPNVAVDVAGQLLKSLNACVLRTGGAALRTVTTLVDDVLRPALAQAGLPPGAIGLVRSADREGARILVSLPQLLPLVILRGSGETTADLAGEAARHGVRTLAHAEGGGVLYVGAAADPEMAERLVEVSLDRLGVCNRLNVLLVDREAEGLLPGLRAVLDRLGIEIGTPPTFGHEWANDPDRIASVTVRVVDSVEHAVSLANDETSGLAAAIVTDDAAAAERFLSAYRGTTAFWNATTRFTDGFALTGAPETGINVDRVPGPRGPVTYGDLWLRQYRVVGSGTERR